MEWTDRGVVLATKRHGDSGLIVEALTYAHGRHMGLVRGGRSARLRSAFQPGNTLELTWRARLEEHLGVYSGDMIVARAASIMEDRSRLLGLTVCASLGRLLAERDPVPRLVDQFETLLDGLTEGDTWLTGLVRFEMAILNELGFGLDLTSCALTGVKDDLAWISPKTGRAASRKAGDKYADRLLALPKFLALLPNSADDLQAAAAVAASTEDLIKGLCLTGHFLDRHVYGPRSITAPEARATLVANLVKSNSA